MRAFLRIGSAITALLLILLSSGDAQWATDATLNNPVFVGAGRQYGMASVSDGQGGMIVAWHEQRGDNFDIYAQRVGVDGSLMWNADGVLVCGAKKHQVDPVIISDGRGGAIIAWRDGRKGNGSMDISAQRINPDATFRWQKDGVAICTAQSDQDNVKMISDGSGGAILAWSDRRSAFTNGSDVYAQRITGVGQLRWPGAKSGLAVCRARAHQFLADLVTDGLGGALIVWGDFRVAPYGIFGQHVNATGHALWARGGKDISPNGASYPGISSILSDGAGGLVYAYSDYWGDGNVYVQHVDGSGNGVWQRTLCSAVGRQSMPFLVSDNQGGYIAAWFDERNHVGGSDIYAQRLDNSGVPQWTTDGIFVTGGSDNIVRTLSPMIEDGFGGAILTWEASWNIYAQRLDAQGAVKWGESGLTISSTAGKKQAPSEIPDGVGGTIITWNDWRNAATNEEDIFAQRVGPEGSLGGVVVSQNRLKPLENFTFKLAGNYPNPFNPTTTISFELKQEALVTLKISNTLGQEVTELLHNDLMDGGAQEVEFDASSLSSGVYYYTVVAREADGSAILFSNTRKMVLMK